MIEIGSLEHVALAYRDTDAAADWFCDVLGFEKIREMLHPAHGRNLYFLKDPAGKSLIEIIPMPAGDEERLSQWSTDHIHVAFDVKDMEAAVAALAEAGVELEGGVTELGGNKLAFFRDPEGAPMQLVQRPQPLL